MGNGIGCLVPAGNGKGGVDIEFLEPLDEGLGHSFCYVRPVIESPAITPSNSERFTIDSSMIDSENHSGSFRQEAVEEPGLQRPHKSIAETTFRTISGASVSANAPSTRTVTAYDQCSLFAGEPQDRAASFEGTASFTALPLQPVPRGSGPLNGFMSGPLERGFTSGPLERGAGFMSGPIEKGMFLSGPLESTDKSNFSAPLAFGQRKATLGRLMRSMSKPMRSALSRTFSKNSGPSWVHRLLLHPASRFVWQSKEAKFRTEEPRNCFDVAAMSGTATSVGEHSDSRNLQWAHGKAGEDRVHVVLSEEHGWLFVGIYDGFNGPDAPDFLMSNLYRAIDKELEGLLWDYDNHPRPKPPECDYLSRPHEGLADMPESRNEDPLSQSCELDSRDRLETGDAEAAASSSLPTSSARINDLHETAADSEDGKTCTTDISNAQSAKVPESVQDLERMVADGTTVQDNSPTFTSKLAGQGRRSRRLYELFKMEDADLHSSSLERDIDVQRVDSLEICPNACKDDIQSRENLSVAHTLSCSASGKGDSFSSLRSDTNSMAGAGPVSKESNDNARVPSSVTETKSNVAGSLIGSKLRKMYRKQKSLRKKLFPWSYDWHREQADDAPRKVIDSLAQPRRCKTGTVDHAAVLKALSRALEITEEAYMEMVDKVLDKNPELGLMGSCVLVMLMKDQDVYVMNLGDSRAILAQERLNDHLGKDDVRRRMRCRDPVVRMELDRISEESPIHNQNSQCTKINKNREISLCRLKMRAFQLSTDHSTSVEEEVLRIRKEHPDDDQSILNGRVKGQLKVSRAFGAGFLKKAKWNEALLEMFRIDYIGNSPYLSCIPSVAHHRLCSNDRFLVLSSDGLYQYFSNEEVVSHVEWFLENVPEGDPAQYLITELLLRAAKKNGMDFHELLDIPHGDRRKYHDDVSVMVVSLEGRIWRSSG
ncbi:phosphatase 2C 32 protein [Nymphaea thermarum]|nr:phosphatase 2C 32 protein [Nymphaea thermarum]